MTGDSFDGQTSNTSREGINQTNRIDKTGFIIGGNWFVLPNGVGATDRLTIAYT
jgi:hypothetical protein